MKTQTEIVEKQRLAPRLAKGFTIGASMLIPGASGGTMAIILGIYDDLIHAVSCLREDVKGYGLLLFEYAFAGVLGILLLSGPLLKAVTLWHQPMMFLFLGAIIASILPLYRKATQDPIRVRNLLAIIIGGAVSYGIALLPKGIFTLDYEINIANILLLVVTGIIIALALVLPGISASYLLLILGIYDLTLEAISHFNLAFLIPLAAGVILGTFLCAGILEREMKRHPQFTYMLIIGFVLESVKEVFPGLPSGANFLYCAAAFLAGLGVVLWIGRKTV